MPRFATSLFLMAISLLAWRAPLCRAQGRVSLESRLADSMKMRDDTLRSQGFHCKYAFEEANRVSTSKATVEYHQKGAFFRIVFIYHETTNPDFQGATNPKREYSLDARDFREMDYSTGQGAIDTPATVQERIVDNVVLPTQFWLDYRDISIASLCGQPNFAVNEANTSAIAIVEHGQLAIWFNRAWGLLPQKTRFSLKDGTLSRELLVSKAKEIVPGLFVPEAFSCQTFGPAGANKDAVPLNRMNWTLEQIVVREPERAIFSLSFPKGAIVTDSIKDTGYQVGRKIRPGDTADDTLVEKITNPTGGQHRAPRPMSYVVVLIIVFFGAVLLYLFRRFRHGDLSP